MFFAVAPAERQVQVIERSLEIRHDERPVTALRKGPVVKIECPDPALNRHLRLEDECAADAALHFAKLDAVKAALQGSM